MKGQNGILGHVIGGWHLSGVTTFESVFRLQSQTEWMPMVSAAQLWIVQT